MLHTVSTLAWRLIDSGSCSGAANMAIDEAIASCFNHLVSRPVLRIYGWFPHAVSIGRFQDAASDINLEYCAGNGIDVVRRITGGGAVYHAGELTYSIICSPAHPLLASSVQESFRILTAFILDFYHSLGLSADYAANLEPAGSRFGERTAFCFAGKERYDIIANGRKIGGNAQRRTRNAIFQHGSVPVENHLEKGLACLKHRPAGIAQLATCLNDEGVSEDAETLKQLLISRFEERFGLLDRTAQLTAEEQETAHKLAADKYGAESWNLEGVGSAQE